jgi:CDP-diacylglycerol--glycerol-3-phosphate 3-phosphatidyltransferase
MIDGLTKDIQDRFWDRLGRVCARTGLTANQVTWLGTVLIVAHAAGFLVHQRAVWFGAGLAVFELLDNIDGAVARVTGTSSRDGAYLDAMTDRAKDMVTLAAIAYVYDAWVPAFFGIAGANITSYAKARASMEAALDNRKWPDLFERLERIAYVVIMLVASTVWPAHRQPIVQWGLWGFAALTLLTAVQRFFRARTLLRDADAKAPRVRAAFTQDSVPRPER